MTLRLDSACQRGLRSLYQNVTRTKTFVITVISPLLVNVSLGWYLLLLDFGIKRCSGRVYLQPHPPLLQENCVRGLLAHNLVVPENGRPEWESRDKGPSSLSRSWAWECRADVAAVCSGQDSLSCHLRGPAQFCCPPGLQGWSRQESSLAC